MENTTLGTHYTDVRTLAKVYVTFSIGKCCVACLDISFRFQGMAKVTVQRRLREKNRNPTTHSPF